MSLMPAVNMSADDSGGFASEAQGNTCEFQETLELYQTMAETEYVSPIAFAILYANLDQKDEAFAWLNKAYEERSLWLTYLRIDPQFDSIRDDPRFADLLARIGL